jgi:hypothetical protein
MCRNCVERQATFGCFCGKCLSNMKKDKKRYKKNELLWKAIEFGSGDLWRGNT